MNIGIKRRKIEDNIVAAFNKVDFGAKQAAWVESDTFEDFVFSFFDLRRYYELGDDTTVGLEAVRVYMDGLRALQAVRQDRKVSIDTQESAGRLIYELNYQMEAVMYEVDRNRQENSTPDGPPSPGGNVPISSN